MWGVFRHAGLSTRCSESSILLQELLFKSFLDTFWDYVRFLFIAKHISGAHLVLLRAPAEASFTSLDDVWHLQRITFRSRFTFCLFLGPVCCPWGLFSGPCGTKLFAVDVVSFPTLGCIQLWFQVWIHSGLITVRTPCDMFALGFSFLPS